MSLRTFERHLRIERQTRRSKREQAAKRARLADLAPGADGSCTERMTGLASESPSTLSGTPGIVAAATNRPAAGEIAIGPCEACTKARDVLHSTACYQVFDADGRAEVLCPWCYSALRGRAGTYRRLQASHADQLGGATDALSNTRASGAHSGGRSRIPQTARRRGGCCKEGGHGAGPRGADAAYAWCRQLRNADSNGCGHH